MFKTISDFEKAWGYEGPATAKLLGKLTDASLAQRVGPNHATLGWLAWHITSAIPEMCGRTGLKVDGPAPDSKTPAKAADIHAAYEKASKSLLEQVKSLWKDETLEVKDDMYGEQWKRSETLLSLVLHQAHHRGQITVLMRQAGLPVPGTYGPSCEEWAAMGMKPPAI
jgi:uncharacterized damage-inducible protein DinB